MVCSQCKAAVPDESTFCLRCGARIVRLARPSPGNGRGTAPSAAPAGAVEKATAAPVGKQPYALSFKPLADERLRYRVARWVCEVAPAHGLADVQADLSRGEFATFLALTAEEADVTRQRIQKLGAHPALWSLAPASAAEMLLSTRERPEEEEGAWTPKRKFAAVGIGMLVLLVFGLFVLYLWGPGSHKPVPLPTAPPTAIPAPRSPSG